jgi:hypothetical protein
LVQDGENVVRRVVEVDIPYRSFGVYHFEWYLWLLVDKDVCSSNLRRLLQGLLAKDQNRLLKNSSNRTETGRVVDGGILMIIIEAKMTVSGRI